MIAAALLPLALWASARSAAPDPVMDAAADELRRSLAGLSLDGRRPHALAYRIVDQRLVSAGATFGAPRDWSESRRRLAAVDVRVGSEAFDNTNFMGPDGYGHSPFTIQVPFEDGAAGVRHALWWVTDASFKSALQRLSQKDAFRRAKELRGAPPDSTPAPVAVVDAGAPPAALSLERARSLALAASAAFRTERFLQTGFAGVNAWEDATRRLDSEGRRLRRDDARYELVLSASAQAPDGMPLALEEVRRARALEDLPSDAEAAAAARALARELAVLRAAPELERPYIGPVLFEGAAAGEFFAQLLAEGLSAPREPWLEDESQRDIYSGGELTGRLGLRVAGTLLSAYDDPSQASFGGRPLYGHWPVDDEGVPARRVELIRRGVLVDLPLGRAPTAERSGSNGHARSALEHLPSARAACLFVEAEGALSAAGLRAELLRRAAEAGLDHGVIVRRLAPSGSRQPGELLSAPLTAVKLTRDGREEPFRGAVFDAVTMRALRDVAAAGQGRRVHDYPLPGPYGRPDDEAAASLVHPDVLVAELELVPETREPDRLPVLPSPLEATR